MEIFCVLIRESVFVSLLQIKTKNTAGIIDSPVRQMLPLVDSSDGVDHDIGHRLVK